MRHNYKQFICVNDRITLPNGVYRLIVPSRLNTLCAQDDMKATVVPKTDSKFQVIEILMLLIITACCVLVQRRENPTRKSDRVTWSGSRRPWTIAGMELEA
jgi:hypothetical protein